MEPISPTLVAVAKKEVIKRVGNLIKTKVIEKWSLYRAQKFYESFLDEVQKQADIRSQSADLDDLLDKVSAKDEASSLLFDAYRRVCLSASRELGPRIIGLLTAEIVMQERSATEGEECMFQAAETLNDVDFREFVDYVNTEQARLSDKLRAEFETLRYTRYVVSEDEAATELEGGYLSQSAPFEIGAAVGLWALRLKHLGLIHEERSEKIWTESADSERYIDVDMRFRRTIDCIVTTPECHRLLALVERASAVAGQEDD